MKLDYEIYKLLTPEEKEEYNYKFRDKIHPFRKFSYLIIKILKVSSFVLALIMLFSIFIVTLKTNIGAKITGETILMIMKLLLLWLYSVIISYGFAFSHVVINMFFSGYMLEKFLNNILYKEVIDDKEVYKRKDEKQQEE